ncbi:uncharacterized protein LOC144295740 isoform X2 [Canis aureus]
MSVCVCDGPCGCLCNGPYACVFQSKDKAQVSSIAVTADVLVYVADQKGFVHVYDIKEYGLQGPELQFPKNVMVWRAHVSVMRSNLWAA